MLLPLTFVATVFHLRGWVIQGGDITTGCILAAIVGGAVAGAIGGDGLLNSNNNLAYALELSSKTIKDAANQVNREYAEKQLMRMSDYVFNIAGSIKNLLKGTIFGSSIGLIPNLYPH